LTLKQTSVNRKKMREGRTVDDVVLVNRWIGNEKLKKERKG